MSLLSIPIDIDMLHWPVTVLGYGKRVGIWFQGCSIKCKGCCAKHTWERSSNPTTVGEVLAWVDRLPTDQIDGFTISGGEPFDQPEALAVLLYALRERSTGKIAHDILVYSGHPWSRLARRYSQVVRLTDLVISEPFRELRAPAFLRGSNNQRIHRLSRLAIARYPDTECVPPQKLQVTMEDERLRVIGIPLRGDVERFRQTAADRGLNLTA